jgi:dihydrofolate synthase/folylpolyglutamate synthase
VTITFQQALEDLYGQERRRDALGLEGTRALLGALGNPERRFHAVHVAGTNGKGSVCAIVERALREAGVRTGLFTSPHLVDYRERIRVDGRWVEASWLEERLDHIRRLPEGIGRTFFEVTTALAFDWFARASVEWAVVEVGLGGRLDCTNVLEDALAVITPIDLDHTEVLGADLASIAREKAGIIRAGATAVSAPQLPEAERVLREVAAERGASLSFVAADGARAAAVDELPATLRGVHQRGNARLALAALVALRARGVEIPALAARSALARARWPGRLERSPREPRLWWDGAHNVAAIEVLAQSWLEDLALAPPASVVLALSRDKDAGAICSILSRRFRTTHVVATASRSSRALEPERVERAAKDVGLAASARPDVLTAVEHALSLAGKGSVLLTGSLFAVGEAMERFGGAPGEWL